MEVSIIIPCFEAETYLGATLRSALHQTHPPREIIVVDDGSKDRSADVAESFGDPVRVLRCTNGGAAEARRAGAAEAGAAALMFLDADDLLAPDVLASLTAVLADHPEAVAICPWMRYERQPDGVWLARPASCAPRGPRQDDLSAWLTGWYHPPCAVLWSRAAFERTGGWNACSRVNNDGLVMMRGLVRGNRLVLSETGTAFYRRMPGEEVSLSGARHSRRGLEARLFVIDDIRDRLAAAARLAIYAVPLGRAYARIEGECRGRLDDLARRAATARHGLPVPDTRHRPEPHLLRHPGAPAATISRQGWHEPDPGGAPAVSVVIPAYNRPGPLRRAIDSVLAQDFGEFELIVVDDASPDDIGAVVVSYGDPRLRYLRQDRNRGVAAARNRGIAAARAPFIAFLDSDDAWVPGKLSRQLARMRAAPARVGLVYGGVENVHADRREVVLPRGQGAIFARMLATNLLHGAASNGLVRRAVFDMVGGFDETFPAIEDYEMWLRLCRFWEVAAIEAPLSLYYEEARAGARRSRDTAANLRARELLHARYRHEMRRAGVEHHFLLETARRLGRSGRRRRAVRTVLKTLRHHPRQWRLYGWLPFLLVPHRARRLAARGVRGIGRRTSPHA